MKREITLLATLLTGLLLASTVQARDWEQWWLGEWEVKTQDQMGARIHSLVRYKADGTYAGFKQIISYGTPMTFPENGRWTIVPGTESSFTLTVKPDQSTGGGLKEASAYLEVKDENTVYNRQDKYYGYRKSR